MTKMRSAILAALNSLIDYLVIPIVVIWVAAHVVFWREGVFAKDQLRGLISGVFFLLLLMAFAYQNGYKGYFRSGKKIYFYVVYLIPLCIAVGGFVIGLWTAYS